MKIKAVTITYFGEGKEVRRQLNAQQAKWVLGARKNVPKPRSLMGQALPKSSEDSYPSSESETEQGSSSSEAGSFSSSVSSETETGQIASSSTATQADMPTARVLQDSSNQVPKPRLDSYKNGELYDPLNIRPTQWRQRRLEHITIEKVYARRNNREEEARYVRRLSAENGKTLDFCYHNGQGHVFYQSMQPQIGRVSYYHNMNTGKKFPGRLALPEQEPRKEQLSSCPPHPSKVSRKNKMLLISNHKT